MGKQYFDLSKPQNSIWFTEQYLNGTAINTIGGFGSFLKRLDFNLLDTAIQNFIKYNDALRLRLCIIDNKVKQYFEDYSHIELELLDFESKEELCTWASTIAATPINLFTEPLYKFYMFRYPDGSGGFVFFAHHIIFDAWSAAKTTDYIANIYNALSKNEPFDYNFPSYLDFLKSEQDYLESPKFKKDEEYWNSQYRTIPEVATIPSQEIVQTFNISYDAGRESYELDKKTMNNINKFCKDNKLSVFNLFMGVVSVYTSNMCNLTDFTIGTPLLNRTSFNEKRTIGMFVSSLPFKVSINPELSFIDFCHNISSESMSLLRHQKYPYEYLLNNIRNSNNVPNLYDIALSYQNSRSNVNSSEMEYTIDWIPSNKCANSLDIHIHDLNDNGKLIVSYDYQLNKYTKQDIISMHNRFLHIINQIIDNKEILIKNIQIIDDSEKKTILEDFNKPFSLDLKNIVEIFENYAKITPNSPAISFDGNTLTYAELNNYANGLSKLLLERNIKPGDCIGIYLDKSLEIIVAILAILKINAIYMPIDINYPRMRLEYIIENSKTNLIITSSKFKKDLDFDLEYININLKDKYYSSTFENIGLTIPADSTAYVLYTSGSTGNPKGVMVTHRGVVRLVKDTNYMTLEAGDKVLQAGSFVFDASTYEIWTALLNGLELFLLKKEDLLNLDFFEEFINKNKINVMLLTTALFNKFSEEKPDMFSNVKYLLTGGEAISSKHAIMVKQTNPNLNLINAYGPTENAVISTCYPITDISKTNIPIGKPISNSTCYIVSKLGNLLPINIPGELWVGGVGVANGYINNEVLTKEVFIDNPFANGKLYKTGDLAKFSPDGNIDFISRIDNQIKIRGFRIELNEITKCISNFTNIKEVYTTINDLNGEKLICTYFSAKQKIDIYNLKEYLKLYLPSYMIPACFMQIDSLPLNINGKVDKKELPEPSLNINLKKFVEPRDAVDTSLLEILSNLLHIDKISMNSDFLSIGGDSLLAINLSLNVYSKFGVKLSVGEILDSKTIIEIADIIKNNSKSKNKKIVIGAKNSKNIYPLSSAQKRIFYTHSMLDENNIVYNVSGGLLINKLLDENKIKEIFNKIVNNHTSFRTSFKLINNDIMQVVEPSIQLNTPVFNNSEADIEALINNFPKHFNLENCPLIRLSIHYIDNTKTLILIDSHHIIMDGTSLNIFMKEFCDLYNGYSVDAATIDYTDYAVWENSYIQSKEIKKSEAFWLNTFKNTENSTLNLPYDFTYPTAKTYKGNRLQKTIDSDTFSELEKLAKQLGVSPYMLFLALFYILLNKYTNQTEIIVGSPIAGRSLKEFQNIIGMFINNLVLKANIDNNESFKSFVLKIKQMVLSSIEHSDYPYDALVKKLNLNSGNSHNPLFDVLFTYQNMSEPLPKIDNMPIEIIPANTDIAKFDISIEIMPSTHKINLEYSTDLFKLETMEAFLEHYLNILENIIENKNSKLKDISILSNVEKNTILNEFNNNEKNYDIDTPVFKLIEKFAAVTPNNIAVKYKDASLTYKELNNRVNKLARFLTTLGIKRGDIVPVYLDKNLDFICSIIAIQKLGAAYLPIHPDYPTDRINYIIKNSESKFMITNTDTKFNNVQIININSINLQNYSCKNVNINVNGNDLAYVIYTSGSTGTPKGITLTHKNLLNFIYSFNDCFNNNFTKNDNCLSVCNISFDVSVCEIFVPLAFGACLVLYPQNTLTDIPLLYDTIVKNSITFLYLPPSLLTDVFSYIQEHSHITTINKMLVGVEPIKNSTLNDYYTISPDIEIINGYGPSETTICCTFYKHNKINNPSHIVPIGKPINNNDIYILDEYMSPQPVGISGELYVSGNNVSLCYLNNKNLTKKAFIQNPFNKEQIMYKTGDTAKWDSNGNIIFIGRNDNQIKYKGYRIELNEITNVAKNIPNVKNAITILNEINGNKQLCLYVAVSTNLTKSYIREQLNALLPTYMVPSYVLIMENLPINLNGKIDKQALPIPTSTDIIEENTIIPPRNKTEEILLNIFKMILNVNNIGITSNFFENGGDSLSAMRIQIEALHYGLHISYGDIFMHPTVKELANIENINNAKDNIKESDFTKYNVFLNNNTITDNMNLEYTSMGNVLLTGVTGFLGAHILDSFMQNEAGNIYCLVRPKAKLSAKKRLISTLSHYFGDKYADEIDNRIFVIEGNVSEYNLGLSEEDFLELSKNINTVIHSAANVKHFGDYDNFKTSNIKGTQKIVDFCEKFNLRLIHVSTLSISGNVFADSSHIENGFTENVEFNETNFYIGQNLDNLYIKSKFEAENIVLDAISNGLQAYIVRIGNLTNRFSDGMFQFNYKENAFVNRFKSIFEIGYIPDYLLDLYTEFTPVDYCANAIIKLGSHYNKQYTVFHLFNDNHITLKKLYDIFNNYGINVKIKSNEEFIKIIKKLLEKPNGKKYLDGIINDLDKNYKLEYNSNILLKSDFTKYVLNLLGFNWPYIDENYIYKYLQFFKNNGYFNI